MPVEMVCLNCRLCGDGLPIIIAYVGDSSAVEIALQTKSLLQTWCLWQRAFHWCTSTSSI